MNRNYVSIDQLGNLEHLDMTREDLEQWAASHETHPAVAMAIHAISSDTRSPEDIWDDPTAAEDDHVCMAIAEYLEHGDFTPTDDGIYRWCDYAVTVWHAIVDSGQASMCGGQYVIPPGGLVPTEDEVDGEVLERMREATGEPLRGATMTIGRATTDPDGWLCDCGQRVSRES